MAFRKGERHQTTIFPPSLEELVPDDSPVRVYNAFVDALDLAELGINMDENKVGNPSYDPRSMLKLLVYGYSYGVRSSRKLEREVNYNISFIWLMGGLKPDHKTIAEFRRNNKKAIQNVLKSSARMCIKFDLIAGNTLFVDGSKFPANASRRHSISEKQLLRNLAIVEERIEKILNECESVDELEAGMPSHVKISEELKDAELLKSKIDEVISELRTKGRKSINPIDPDAARVKDKSEINPGYNAQIVVDEKHGLIVNSDVVAESNDFGQLSSQVEQAHEVLGKKSNTICADSGYARMEEVEKVIKNDINVIIPSPRQAADKKKDEFDKEVFRYDEENDCYTCPVGHKLTKRGFKRGGEANTYKIEKASYCRDCVHYGKCTKSKEGRAIWRNVREKIMENLETEYRKEESQEIYKLRQQRVEHPFGHIKRNLGASRFILRGQEGVKAEMSILSTCFNLRRMMTILGLEQMINTMQNCSAEQIG